MELYVIVLLRYNETGNDDWNRHFGGIKASKETSHHSPKFANTTSKRKEMI